MKHTYKYDIEKDKISPEHMKILNALNKGSAYEYPSFHEACDAWKKLDELRNQFAEGRSIEFYDGDQKIKTIDSNEIQFVRDYLNDDIFRRLSRNLVHALQNRANGLEFSSDWEQRAVQLFDNGDEKSLRHGFMLCLGDKQTVDKLLGYAHAISAISGPNLSPNEIQVVARELEDMRNLLQFSHSDLQDVGIHIDVNYFDSIANEFYQRYPHAQELGFDERHGEEHEDFSALLQR